MGGGWVENPVADVLLAFCVSAFVLASPGRQSLFFLSIDLHARFLTLHFWEFPSWAVDQVGRKDAKEIAAQLAALG
jgi:hypothetical protein